MTPSSESNTRRYKALEISCPACNAAAQEPCRGPDGPMKGLHRRRDLEWNRLQWFKRTEQPNLEVVR